jgi:hypothetical protein
MCDSSTCTYPCGEDEFKGYEDQWTPDRVVYPIPATAGTTRYGVMISRPAHQWEIVAVRAERPRHLAFVSTHYCLDRVLDLASRIAGSH